MHVDDEECSEGYIMEHELCQGVCAVASTVVQYVLRGGADGGPHNVL